MKHGMKPKKKMYGGSMMKKKKKKKMNVGGKMKPDYIDLDKDGNKKESMKKASMDMKEKNSPESVQFKPQQQDRGGYAME